MVETPRAVSSACVTGRVWVPGRSQLCVWRIGGCAGPFLSRAQDAQGVCHRAELLRVDGVGLKQAERCERGFLRRREYRRLVDWAGSPASHVSWSLRRSGPTRVWIMGKVPLWYLAASARAHCARNRAAGGKNCSAVPGSGTGRRECLVAVAHSARVAVMTSVRLHGRFLSGTKSENPGTCSMTAWDARARRRASSGLVLSFCVRRSRAAYLWARICRLSCGDGRRKMARSVGRNERRRPGLATRQATRTVEMYPASSAFRRASNDGGVGCINAAYVHLDTTNVSWIKLDCEKFIPLTSRCSARSVYRAAEAAPARRESESCVGPVAVKVTPRYSKVAAWRMVLLFTYRSSSDG